MHHHDLVVHPLLLLLGQQEVIADQLLLPVVLSQDHSDEQVHYEEVADEQHEHEEQASQRRYNVGVWDQIYAVGSTCLVHDLFPHNIGREYKQCLHSIPYVIKVKKRPLPLASEVYAVPLVLQPPLHLNGSLLAVREESLEVVDADDTEYEVGEDREHGHCEDVRH